MQINKEFQIAAKKRAVEVLGIDNFEIRGPEDDAYFFLRLNNYEVLSIATLFKS